MKGRGRNDVSDSARRAQYLVMPSMRFSPKEHMGFSGIRMGESGDILRAESFVNLEGLEAASGVLGIRPPIASGNRPSKAPKAPVSLLATPRAQRANPDVEFLTRSSSGEVSGYPSHLLAKALTRPTSTPPRGALTSSTDSDLGGPEELISEAGKEIFHIMKRATTQQVDLVRPSTAPVSGAPFAGAMFWADHRRAPKPLGAPVGQHNPLARTVSYDGKWERVGVPPHVSLNEMKKSGPLLDMLSPELPIRSLPTESGVIPPQKAREVMEKTLLQEEEADEESFSDSSEEDALWNTIVHSGKGPTSPVVRERNPLFLNTPFCSPSPQGSVNLPKTELDLFCVSPPLDMLRLHDAAAKDSVF